MKTLIFLCLMVINIAAFTIYGYDKVQSRLNRRRISEKSLFIVALLGGSLGAWLGMQIFRHKTKHWYFQFGIPLILAVQALLIFWISL